MARKRFPAKRCDVELEEILSRSDSDEEFLDEISSKDDNPVDEAGDNNISTDDSDNTDDNVQSAVCQNTRS